MPTNDLQARAKNRAAQLRHLTPRLAPTERAAPSDFIWAAGFFEGEGTAGHAGGKGLTENVSIVQVNLWPLERMKALFGGSISTRPPKGRNAKSFSWQVSGARARGFIQSIYGLLSPRRQEQIRKALAVGEFKC